MKTIFTISLEVFSSANSYEGCIEYYEKYYKKQYILDEKNEEVYIKFNERFDFEKGDKVTLFGITRIVESKRTDITNKTIVYYLSEWIEEESDYNKYNEYL